MLAHDVVGKGILVPRPWNSLHSVPTWKYLCENLDALDGKIHIA